MNRKLSLQMITGIMLGVTLLATESFALDRKVTVSGECTLEVEPDRGSVVLAAEQKAPDAKTAIRLATALHEKTRNELKKAKIKNLELSSTEYTVQEVMAWENNQNVSKGYVCRIGLKAATTDIAALGEILSIAGEAGIRNTHSLQTYLSDQKTMNEKKKCLSIAAENARDKASELVKSLGGKLGQVIQIVERGTLNPNPPGPVLEGMAMMAKSSPGPTLETGKQSLHQEVDVTFEILP